nr:hypothetical protein [Tanacetum cinerariifolium]
MLTKPDDSSKSPNKPKQTHRSLNFSHLPPGVYQKVCIQAWFMDGVLENSQLHHHCNPPSFVSVIDYQAWTIFAFTNFLRRFLALGWHLEKIHVTWTHLEKKRTRLRPTPNLLKSYAYSAWRRRRRHKVTSSQSIW